MTKVLESESSPPEAPLLFPWLIDSPEFAADVAALAVLAWLESRDLERPTYQPIQSKGLESNPSAFYFTELPGWTWKTDWRRIYNFHVRASMDGYRAKRMRSWHSRQARVIRARHKVDTSPGFSWSDFCSRAAEQLPGENCE